MMGFIYKIIHNQSNIVYVGSTFQELRHRWQQHKTTYNNWFKTGNKRSNIAIYKYFQEFGIENFKIILVKEYEVVDREHLEIYETLWIYKLKSINITIPFHINKLYQKNYRKINEEKLVSKAKEYYQENKEYIKQQRKREYYEGNRKQNNIENTKRLRAENILKKKYFCEICNYTASCKYKLERHFTSQKHMNFS